MDNTQNIDLEAFAKKVADETAAKIAMKQAEQKAAEQAEAKAQAEMEAARTLEGEKIQATIKTGVETGVEKLMADVKADMEKQSSESENVIAKYKVELEEKQAEIQAMQNSKKSFSDRSNSGDLSAWGKEFLHAKILGQITGKGYETDYAKSIMEKAGVSVAAAAAGNQALDIVTATQFEKEMTIELKAAALFRELAVNSKITILPIQPDAVAATFGSGSPADVANAAGNLQGNLSGTEQGAGVYNASSVQVEAHRMSSTTYLDNDTDEQTLVSLMPIISDAMVRAHARATDNMVINGNASSPTIVGLYGAATGTDTGAPSIATDANGGRLDGNTILSARAAMKKYGLNPSELAIICSITAYNDLLQDGNFHDISEVGSDLAIKLTGQVGTIFGIPVIVTDTDSGAATGLSQAFTATHHTALVVNTRNFIIPRLKGVSIETEYQAGNQRTAIVAAQSLGFAQLIAGGTLGFASQAITYTA
jgi:hypothetical protein